MQSNAPGAARVEICGRIGGLERVVEAALARSCDHAGRKVDADEAVDPVAHGLAHQAGAAAEIDGGGEAAPGRDEIERFDDQRWTRDS